MVEHHWHEMMNRFNNIKLHQFIVMPNHFHGIVEIVGAPFVGALNMGQSSDRGQSSAHGQSQGIVPTVGDMVGAFKSLSTNDYIRNVKQNNWQSFNKILWQRNYFEHIIRDEKTYFQISEYIQTNPMKWLDDKYHDQNHKPRKKQ